MEISVSDIGLYRADGFCSGGCCDVEDVPLSAVTCALYRVIFILWGGFGYGITFLNGQARERQNLRCS